MNLAPYEAFIRTLAEESGKIIRPYFANPDLTIELKADESIVTVADREAELRMRELIEKTYPDHGIIGEEFDEKSTGSEFSWILDPIDGTISFAGDCPLFGTLIALLHNGQPIVGAIHNPLLEQLCMGDGETTTLNGRAVRVRETDDLAKATLLTTDIKHIAQHQDKPRFDALLERVALFRGWGDCYGYLLLAAGKADIMIDPVMNAWDLLPLIPVVRGAGGIITAWDGGDPVTANSCVAAGPRVHAEVVRILNG
ncbi:MAG: inositol monophosphatase family protein [Verrucomicrobia bacterium]|nr:inositol monophosphatase family protein [Verrucomicrobiota bacterium]MDA1087716.1 inositol monophosphatase family protein [Verrucomicrobiota bacterium]